MAIVKSSDAGSGSIVPETRFRVYGKMNYVIVGFSYVLVEIFDAFLKCSMAKAEGFPRL